jgi:ribosomal protein L37E
LSNELYRQFRAAQDAVVEQRLFDQLQARFQEELAAARAQFERNNAFARTQQDAAATAEFMRRQYPNAVQCPRCGAGPVIPENCYNLQTHHGENAEGGGQISNACPACGFFGRERRDWVAWNGQMR